MPNKLDQIYRSLRLTKYFVKGWGKPENLKRLCEFKKIVSERKTCYPLVPSDYSVIIEKEYDEKDCTLIEGFFISPFSLYLPEVVPEACHKAYFQFVLPKKWADENFKPVILHIAGTGDQYYWRRRQFVAKPLLKEGGIGSVILENPFYGLRKPKEQQRSILHNVSDIFVMGGCLMLESLVLFHYCERIGLGPLGITGLSMGGHMATIAATTWPKPLVIVPCLSGLTASHVFTQGVISQALNWRLLGQQYTSESGLKNEVQKMVNIIEGDAFRAGQQFAKNLSTSTQPVNLSPIESEQVTETLANVSTGNLEIKSSSNTATLRTCDTSIVNNDCDNLSFMSTNADSRNIDVTSDTSVAQSTHKTTQGSGEHAASTEATTNSLLNLVVRLVRASINLNILSGDLKEKESELKKNEMCASEQEALNFMNGIMDELTHLKHYSIPVDTSLTIAVCADDDAYVPIKSRSHLAVVWPGAEVRYVRGGHVRAYVQYQKEFRTAIIDAFQRYRSKYVDEKKNITEPTDR